VIFSPRDATVTTARRLALHKTKRMVVLFANKPAKLRRLGGTRHLSLSRAGDSAGCRPRAAAQRPRTGRRGQKKGASAAGFGAPSLQRRSSCGGKAKPDLARKRAPSTGVPLRPAAAKSASRSGGARRRRPFGGGVVVLALAVLPDEDRPLL